MNDDDSLLPSSSSSSLNVRPGGGRFFRSQTLVFLTTLGDGSPVGDARDVEVLPPLFLDVRRGEGRGPQGLLRLVDGPLARNAQNEGSLVRSRSARGDPESRVPTSEAKRRHRERQRERQRQRGSGVSACFGWGDREAGNGGWLEDRGGSNSSCAKSLTCGCPRLGTGSRARRPGRRIPRCGT